MKKRWKDFEDVSYKPGKNRKVKMSAGVRSPGNEPNDTEDYPRVDSGQSSKASEQIKSAGCPRNNMGLTESIYIPVTPVSKPRMTQRDKWKKRPCVLRYRAYCDALRKFWQDAPFPAAGYHAIFYLPMPKSWSKKKKAEMNGKPHQQKPDKDNLEKALLDALCIDDSYIYDGRVSKYWSDAGYIEIYINEMRQAA